MCIGGLRGLRKDQEEEAEIYVSMSRAVKITWELLVPITALSFPGDPESPPHPLIKEHTFTSYLGSLRCLVKEY